MREVLERWFASDFKYFLKLADGGATLEDGAIHDHFCKYAAQAPYIDGLIVCI